MYTTTNYPSKAALRRDFLAGKRISTFQPGGLFPATRDGRIALEGPHYPKPHKWYASAVVADGVIVELDGKKAPNGT